MQLRNIIVIVASILIMAGCKKSNQEEFIYPPIPNVPHIMLKSVNLTEVTEFVDSLVFIIAYIDGDGDIGHENPDSNSVFLTDNRVPLTMEYHVSPVTPGSAEIVTRGDLAIVLENTIILNTANTEETVTFDIRLKDKAGNWSNTLTTTSITISR